MAPKRFEPVAPAWPPAPESSSGRAREPNRHAEPEDAPPGHSPERHCHEQPDRHQRPAPGLPWQALGARAPTPPVNHLNRPCHSHRPAPPPDAPLRRYQQNRSTPPTPSYPHTPLREATPPPHRHPTPPPARPPVQPPNRSREYHQHSTENEPRPRQPPTTRLMDARSSRSVSPKRPVTRLCIRSANSERGLSKFHSDSGKAGADNQDFRKPKAESECRGTHQA